MTPKVTFPCLVCGLPVVSERGRRVHDAKCKQIAWRMGFRRGMVALPGGESEPVEWERSGNLTACKTTVAAMRADGLLAERDEAVVAHALSLAQAVDKLPASATLAREYREALNALLARGAGAGDAAKDVWRALIASEP